MSMPNIPDIEPKIKITRDEAINLLLASIALEEIGLANILDQESKKLKYVFELDGELKPSFCEIMQVNESVRKMIETIGEKEILLKHKLEDVIDLTCNCSTSTSTTSTTTTSTTTTTTSCSMTMSTTTATTTSTTTSTMSMTTTSTRTTTSCTNTMTTTTRKCMVQIYPGTCECACIEPDESICIDPYTSKNNNKHLFHKKKRSLFH